ncbi:MAG: AAA family ATPase [Pseudooceanicola sp.]
MSIEKKKIAFISADPQGSGGLANSFAGRDDVEITHCDTTLTLMNGAAVELAREWSSIVFRTEQDVERDIAAVSALRRSVGQSAVIVALTDGTTSLADARRLNEAGVDDVLPDGVDADTLLKQIERHRPIEVRRDRAAPTAERGKVIAVCPARGGIGATTVATNLADQLLARRGLKKKPTKRVAILDLDIQFGAVSSFLDVPPGEGLYVLATETVEPDQTFVDQSLSRTGSGVSVFAAPTKLVPTDAIRPEQVAALIEILRRDHDYVVIDVPRMLAPWMSAVLDAADKLMLVMDTTVPTVRQARRLLDVFEEEHLRLPVELVVSGERKPLFLAAHQKEASRLLDRPLPHWLPFDPKAARAAVDLGAPLSKAARGSRLRKALDRVTRSVARSLQEQATKNAG